MVIGVSDDGSPVGIQADEFENEDKMGLHLVNIVKTRMGIQAMTSLHVHFDDHDDCRVMVVTCRKASTPVFVKDGDTERFLYSYRAIHDRIESQSDTGIHQTEV